MYRYKGEVPFPLLGRVDLLGVAEAGFKTEQLNAVVNVKTADKDLEFGPEKCKTMTVSKKPNHSYQDLDFQTQFVHILFTLCVDFCNNTKKKGQGNQCRTKSICKNQ